MSAADIPLWKRTARVSRLADRVVIDYLGNEITIEGEGAVLFGKVYPLLDGKNALEGIARTAAVEPTRLRALAGQLERAGVLALIAAEEQGDPRAMSGRDFYQLHRKHSAHWLEPVYAHPLWERIVDGKATRAQVIGFAFEKYHYIEGAYEHMAIAAANATPAMMPHLARHFIEEYTHGDIYRKGLMSIYADDLVVRAQPLPSTRALVNFLSETAQRNSFAYYAGNELLQMTENTSDAGDGAAVDRFYDAMRKHYPYTSRLIDSFIAHTRADQKLGHESVFAEMCDSVPPLSPAEVRDALETTRYMAEHLELFMDGIDRAYGPLSAVPRFPEELGSC
jgi:pyrroloquinoline quinone (PQQ) biosynthesis protein C